MARIAGVLYLAVIAIGVFPYAIVPAKYIVAGNPEATVRNIAAAEQFWRIGFTAELAVCACAVALAVLLFILLRPVSAAVALVSLAFDLAAIAIEAVKSLGYLAALLLVTRTEYATAFSARELAGSVSFFLRLHDGGFAASLLFFSFVCLTRGYLIVRSGFLPKTIGYLYEVTFACYLTNSLAVFLAPALERVLFPAILLPAFLTELSFSLWLIVKGVDVPKWFETRAAQRRGFDAPA